MQRKTTSTARILCRTSQYSICFGIAHLGAWPLSSHHCSHCHIKIYADKEGYMSKTQSWWCGEEYKMINSSADVRLFGNQESYPLLNNKKTKKFMPNPWWPILRNLRYEKRIWETEEDILQLIRNGKNFDMNDKLIPMFCLSRSCSHSVHLRLLL